MKIYRIYNSSYVKAKRWQGRGESVLATSTKETRDVIKQWNYLSVDKPVIYSVFIVWMVYHIMAVPFGRYPIYNLNVIKVSRFERSNLYVYCTVLEHLYSTSVSDPQAGQNIYTFHKLWLLLVISLLNFLIISPQL